MLSTFSVIPSPKVNYRCHLACFRPLIIISQVSETVVEVSHTRIANSDLPDAHMILALQRTTLYPSTGGEQRPYNADRQRGFVRFRSTMRVLLVD